MNGLAIGSVQWLEWAKASFDLLKGVAWPVAIFWIVWLFRKQIRERIPHVIEVGPTRALFQQPQAQPVEAAPSLPNTTDKLPTVVEIENDVRARLEMISPEYRESELIQAVATFRLLANFEFIFASIFGSQIEFLRELKKAPRSLSESETYFKEQVMPNAPEFFSEWGVENWREYLLAQELALIEDSMLVISIKGIDFLQWVSATKHGFIRGN